MSRPWFSLVLTGILCFLSLPIFATSLLMASAGSATDFFAGRLGWRGRSTRIKVRRPSVTAEFAFERAIEAYEELIDSYAPRRP